MNNYQLITWPESQLYMQHPDFHAEAILLSELEHLAKFGSQAYFIPDYIVSEVKNQQTADAEIGIQSTAKKKIAEMIDKLEIAEMRDIAMEAVDNPQIMLLINNCDTPNFAWKKRELLVPLTVAIQAIKLPHGSETVS